MKKKIAISIGCLLVAWLALAENRPGIKPRYHAKDYAATLERERLEMGASLLMRSEILRAFVSDLTQGYLVVEVGLYPEGGVPLEVSRKDFSVRLEGQSALIRPAEPALVAAMLQKSARNGKEVVLYPSVGVGYESGGYDPYTGRRVGGWRTSAGVGVGVGGTGEGTNPEDQRVMEMELEEKSLPEGKTDKAVCGYLLFPIQDKLKKKKFRLEFDLQGERLIVDLKEDKAG
jgi:hypothetical protein